MPSDVNLGVRSPKGLLPLRFPIAHDHVVILKFNSPFRIITGHKLGASRLRMAPEGLFKACPPAACTIARPDLPARFGTPVDLRSTPIRERGFAAYLSGCARQLLTVRCAHCAGGASLSTFGFVTIVPRYLLPQVMPSHSFAALTALVVRRVKGCITCRVPQKRRFSLRTPPEGALAGAPGSGTLPPCSLIL